MEDKDKVNEQDEDKNPSENLDIQKAAEISPNKRFYRVDFIHEFNEVLGVGAFKIVYKGIDNDTGCEIAWNTVNLKFLPDSTSELRRGAKKNRR